MLILLVVVGSILFSSSVVHAQYVYNTQLSLSSTLNPAFSNQSITFWVNGVASGCPGTVWIYNGSQLIGYGQGTGSFSAGPLKLAPGTYTISAYYSGYSNYMVDCTAASAQLTQVVYKPTQGFFSPKYMVVGVTYAPPGSSSNVQYGETSLVGETVTFTSSLSSEFEVPSVPSNSMSAWTVSGGVGVPVSGTGSTTLTQTTTASMTVTISKATTIAYKTMGTPTLNPVTSDYDIVWLWVNPQVIVTVGGTLIQWNGFGYDPNDPAGSGGPDIVGIPVGWLNGDWGNNSAVDNILQRSWVTNESWPSGQGPAITCANYVYLKNSPTCKSGDIQQILAADPFTNSSYLSAEFGASPPATTSDGRFTRDSYPPNPITYVPNASTTVYNVVYTDNQSESETLSFSYKEVFGLNTQFSSGLSSTLSNDFTTKDTVTFTDTWLNTVTYTVTITDAVSITPPTCSGDPCLPAYTGPGEFLIYEDNLYGTFAFVPESN